MTHVEEVAKPHLPMALLAQRHRGLGCLLLLPPPTRNVAQGFLPGASGRPALKKRKSLDSALPERSGLESFCSASFAHGTAHTEAQRLGLLVSPSPLCHRAIWTRSHFRRRAAWGVRQGLHKLCWKSEFARQSSSSCLCALVQVEPWADVAEQKLSSLVHSGC